MSQDTNLKSKYEASLLEKYSSMFPHAFIECVKNGVTWLANHNGLTYQTSALISTDNVVYEANKNSILKIGLINVDKPLSGMQYYSVRSMQEEKDSVSGNTIFKVKLDYTAPVGIEIMMIPISYFSPYAEDGSSMFYTKEEVAGLIQAMKDTVTKETEDKLVAVKAEMKTYVDSLFGNMEDIDLDFNKPEVEGEPKPEGEVTEPVSPIQKIVEHLHSLSVNLSELGRDSAATTEQLEKVKQAVEQLYTTVESGTIATPDLNPGTVELPPYYTKEEVDIRLATKVSNVAFEQYVVEAEQKFGSKEPGEVDPSEPLFPPKEEDKGETIPAIPLEPVTPPEEENTQPEPPKEPEVEVPKPEGEGTTQPETGTQPEQPQQPSEPAPDGQGETAPEAPKEEGTEQPVAPAPEVDTETQEQPQVDNPTEVPQVDQPSTDVTPDENKQEEVQPDQGTNESTDTPPATGEVTQ